MTTMVASTTTILLLSIGSFLLLQSSVLAQDDFDPNDYWGYFPGSIDPPYWPVYFEACGGTSQSPIDIRTSAAFDDTTLQDFVFHGFDRRSKEYDTDISNDGHTVMIKFSNTQRPYVTGGSLPDLYILEEIHFHWGADSTRGSEHTLDSMRFPMEVHFVLFRNGQDNVKEALKTRDGVAVLGAFFAISESDNPGFYPILDELADVRYPGTKKDLDSPIKLDSFLPINYSGYYRYSGSVTTPGCVETVIWTMFDSTISVSEAQMSIFRTLASSELYPGTNTLRPLVDNFRPVQPLNSRTVRRKPGIFFPLCNGAMSSQAPVNDYNRQTVGQKQVSYCKPKVFHSTYREDQSDLDLLEIFLPRLFPR